MYHTKQLLMLSRKRCKREALEDCRVPINGVILCECFIGRNLDMAVSCVLDTFSKHKVGRYLFSLSGILATIAASSICYVSRLVLSTSHLHQLQPVLNNQARSNASGRM